MHHPYLQVQKVTRKNSTSTSVKIVVWKAKSFQCERKNPCKRLVMFQFNVFSFFRILLKMLNGADVWWLWKWSQQSFWINTDTCWCLVRNEDACSSTQIWALMDDTWMETGRFPATKHRWHIIISILMDTFLFSGCLHRHRPDLQVIFFSVHENVLVCTDLHCVLMPIQEYMRYFLFLRKIIN